MHTDEIELRGLVFFGRHGVNPEETELGQRFSVDLTVWLDLSSAADSDDLNDTVSYSALYKLIRAEIEGTPAKLLEHVAGRILSKVLANDTRITKARVAVGNVSPPLKGSTTGEVYVRLERSRA
ncbi:MAG TPA: dihydroneopterin aldolase [Chloroflexia bacterium]|nr:dihydroneopterin aldolase [Chloroflexia bacterium]